MKAKKYSKALICHLQWKVKLKKFLGGQGHFDFEHLSPGICKFGECLHSDDITRYASPSEVREIDKLHAAIHEKARRAYDLKLAGKDSYAKQQFQELEDTSMKLVSLLSILKVIGEN